MSSFKWFSKMNFKVKKKKNRIKIRCKTNVELLFAKRGKHLTENCNLDWNRISYVTMYCTLSMIIVRFVWTINIRVNNTKTEK